LKIKKSYIILPLTSIVLAGILIIVQYYHFQGIKDSLEILIEKRTGGKYKLDLGETSYDFIRLDFTLKNARVYRIDTTTNSRMYSVELPHVKINLGSLKSYFSFGQINVKEFVITEPFIVLQKEKLEKKKILVSSELSNLLHIVKEILDTFDIHSFKINKGSVTMNRDKESVHIGLIDLLAKEWNVRKLTPQSQIEMRVGTQQVNAFDHHLSFKQIEYSYLKRQLTVSDFSYHHLDSVTGARLGVKGKAFIVYHVDWQALSSVEQYKLKKIELIEPDFKGSFPMAKNKRSAEDISKIFHNALGELMIDSINVRHARLHLAYKQTKDSTSMSFQNASFSMTEFKLLNDKESFEVGEVRFNLNHTEFNIGKNYVLKFDSLFFNHYLHRKLYIEGLQLRERNSNKPFLTSRQVVLNHFNAFDFLLYKKIKAALLEFNEISVNLSPEMQFLESQATDKTFADTDIEIDQLKLAHAEVHYSDKGRKVVTKELNVKVHSLHLKQSKTVFKFDHLDSKLIQYQDDKLNLAVQLQSVALNNKSLKVGQVVVKQNKGLTASMNKVLVQPGLSGLTIPRQLSLAHADKLQISGSLISMGKKKGFTDFKIHQLLIDTVGVDISTNQNKISLNGLNVKADSIKPGAAYPWNTIQAKLSDIHFENSGWIVSGQHALINTPSKSQFNNLKIRSTDSSIDFQTSELVVRPIDYDNNSLSFVLNQSHLTIHRKEADIAGTMDSVTVTGFKLDSGKEITALQIYRPVMQIKLKESENKSAHFWLPSFLKETSVYDGQFIVNSKREPVFIYGMDAQWRNNDRWLCSLDSLTHSIKKMNLSLRKLSVSPNELSINKISITPLQSFAEYSSTGFERDLLKLNFNDVRIAGYQMDSLLYGDNAELNEVKVGSFQIDVMRDKRLPDAPFKDKGLFSRHLSNIAWNFNIPHLQFNNGSVTVHQISDKTNETGTIVLNTINGEIKNISNKLSQSKKPEMNATLQIFGQGQIKVSYRIPESDRFKLDVTAERLDFSTFNRMVQPLQSVRFKSGRLRTLKISTTADDSLARGNALINYRDLRIDVLKTDKTNFRNELTSLVANELIKNKRKNAVADFVQLHDKGKAEFAYWVKMILSGASESARHGRRKK
jgi:hypothetical protein